MWLMKWIVLGIIVLGSIAGGIWYFFSMSQPLETRERGALTQTHSVYERESIRQTEILAKPGSGSNINRANLHMLLSQMLTADLTDDERKTLAEQARGQAEKLRTDIDRTKGVHTSVVRAIESIQDVSIASRAYSKKQESLISLMMQKQVTAESITTTLYAINDQTEGIITRILDEEGALTPEHIQYINEETSDAETRHDQLTQLYHEYESLGDEVESMYTSLMQ